MVQVNEEKREITVTINGSTEDLENMQKAIIELLSAYDYENNYSMAGSTVYNALCLLREIMPDFDQQKRGFADQGN